MANQAIARDGDYVAELNTAESSDVVEQVRRLAQRLTMSFTRSIVVKPRFPGCGMVDEYDGDVLAGRTLFEVKAGDRSFRSIDIRQVLTYLALNQVAKKYIIESAGLINPRIGVSIEFAIDEICYEISGLDAADLLGAITHAISSGEISR